MNIERLALRHVAQVAALHVRTLDGLLTLLGPLATREYYAACVESPLAIGLVASEGERVLGFALGAVSHPALRRDVMRRRPLGIVAGITLGAVRHPRVVAWLARSIRDGSDSEDYDTSAPELIYIAVNEDGRSHGTGRTLVQRFTAALHAAGQAAFEVSVAEDNEAGVSFYERLGFARVGRYYEFGRWHVRYRLEISKAR